jgi:hypothetical protein
MLPIFGNSLRLAFTNVYDYKYGVSIYSTTLVANHFVRNKIFSMATNIKKASQRIQRKKQNSHVVIDADETEIIEALKINSCVIGECFH